MDTESKLKRIVKYGVLAMMKSIKLACVIFSVSRLSGSPTVAAAGLFTDSWTKCT